MAAWDDEDHKKPVKDSWEDDEDSGNIKASWEDEDDDVKDSWDQEDKKSEPKKTEKKAAATTSKKVEVKDMTEEEKLEAQKLADLNNALGLFDLNKSLDEISIKTKEDYTTYINVFYAKFNTLSSQPLYNEFLEELIKTLCKNVSLDAMRKISNSVKTIYDTKQMEERNKAKEKAKPKAKGKIKIEFDRVKGDFDSFLKDSGSAGRAVEEDDGDDFM